jgi:hypothetical protein
MTTIKQGAYICRHTFLNDPEDITWLRETHIPDLPQSIRSAVLYGNEDFPKRVDAYEEVDPSLDDRMIMYLPVNGELTSEGGMPGIQCGYAEIP